MSKRNLHEALAWSLAAVLAAAAHAEEARTDPGAASYPGTLSLAVDLRDTAHRIYHVQETIPAAPGPLVLLYPKWIPGEHGPTGPIEFVAGLRFSAGGHPLAWRRDPVDVYALHLDVPPDRQSVDVSFDYLSPGPGGRYGKSLSATPEITVLEWNQVVLYPAGVAAGRIMVQASVQMPEGWSYATALEPETAGAAAAPRFRPTSLDTLVDSPLAAGQNFRQITLTRDPVPVRLDVIADRPANLAISEEQIRQHRNLVDETYALFGARHFAHYDFLLVLTDYGGHFGLEHHQSSDDRTAASFFTDPDYYATSAGLMPHEFVHSWNGKYRRPAGLISVNYATPMQGELLWVYEGLASYWGSVLAARAHMRSLEQFRDDFALMASAMESARGRTWRPLQDTADEAQILYHAQGAWANWSRSVDFYDEGALIWLDADTLIREGTGGERSLDDFARRFFGAEDGELGPRIYTFGDVVQALDEVYHYDWVHFLRRRLDAAPAAVPLDGIRRSGWGLAYSEEPNGLQRAEERSRKRVDLSASIGFILDAGQEDGVLKDVIWDSPAFRAGLAPGALLVAVNGTRYSARLLKDAIRAARDGKQPIELLVEDFDHFRTVAVDYRGGLRFPHLVRIPDTEDRLGAIAHPRK